MRILQNLAIAVCLCYGGVAQAQDGLLQSINGVLGAVNGLLSGNGQAGNTASKGGSPAMYSDIQEQNLTNAIKPLPNKEAVTNMTEAYPTIVKVLSITACATSQSENMDTKRILRYGTSDSYIRGVYFPYLSNHRSGCLVVERIDSYQKIANNAFSFKALYVSPQSGESQSIGYKMIKEPSGEWLFKF
jgi:hypothetical protein